MRTWAKLALFVLAWSAATRLATALLGEVPHLAEAFTAVVLAAIFLTVLAALRHDPTPAAPMLQHKTQKQLAYEAKLQKKALGYTKLDATHVWMKRWPCVILDEQASKTMQRILYFTEHGTTAQTFAMNVELETIEEALDRKRQETK